MDPITMMAIGAGVNVLSGIVAELISKGDRDQAKALLEQAAAQYDIPVPELEKVVSEQIGPSAFEGISTDPALRSAQMNALDKLSDIEKSGGFTLEDRATLNRVRNQTARQASARINNLQENMAARGVGGSGAELAMSLQAGQDEASRAAEAGLETAAQAQKRYFDSILSRGRMAGDIRGQDYGEKARAAEAQDRIAQYNAGAMDRAKYYNAQLPAQRFGMQTQLAAGKAGGKRAMAGWHSGEGQRKANMVQGTGKGISKIFSGMAENGEDDEYGY